MLHQNLLPAESHLGHHNGFAYGFDAKTGDTILAARPGRIIFIDEQWEDGNRTPCEENFVFIEHTGGPVASYVHLTKDGALPRVDRFVKQSEPVIG